MFLLRLLSFPFDWIRVTPQWWLDHLEAQRHEAVMNYLEARRPLVQYGTDFSPGWQGRLQPWERELLRIGPATDPNYDRRILKIALEYGERIPDTALMPYYE